MLTLHLRDLNAGLVEAWHTAFDGVDNVEVSRGDILELEADAIVSPANSFGYMDGGIDLAYSRRFGWELQEKLQARINGECHGELPVGQALIVPTGDAALPWLISAPTMRVPRVISGTVNVYLAMRAMLIAVLAHNAGSKRARVTPISSLLVPGLGTGVGDMPPARAARQMRIAFDAILGGRAPGRRNVGAIWGEHEDLLA